MRRINEGRVAVVTGAGRGIGREHAVLLAETGAKVVVNDLGADPTGEGSDRSPAAEVVDEILAAGGEAVVNGADVSDFDAARGLIDQAVDTFGGLDILVNNAGILRDRMVFSMSEADWDAVITVHLKGTFAPTHHAATYWRARAKAGETNDARVITTSSPSGIYGNVGQSNYGAAKAGIAAFSVITAMELVRYGVTVNCLAPGAYTRMTADLPGWTELDEAAREARHPRWIARVAAWLASPEAAWVTGRVFHVVGPQVGIAEGWRLGPEGVQGEDPTELAPLITRLMGEARPNADMLGHEVTGPGRPTPAP